MGVELFFPIRKTPISFVITPFQVAMAPQETCTRPMWCSVLGAGPRVVATVCTAMVVSVVVRVLMEPAQADILKVALQRLHMESRERL
jgi:hypothetical protein